MNNTEGVAEIRRCLRCAKSQNKHCDTCPYAVFITGNDSTFDYCDTEKLELDALDVITGLTAELEQKTRDVVQLAIESVEREKQLAKLEAEVQRWADAEKRGLLKILPDCKTCKHYDDSCFKDECSGCIVEVTYETVGRYQPAALPAEGVE